MPLTHLVLPALAASLLLAAGPAAAGEGAEADALVTHIEASPPMLLLQGIGVEAGIKLRGHLELGAAAFTLVIPEAFQGDNKDEDWDIRDSGGGLSARWFHRDDGHGLFLGGTVELQNHHLERAGESMDSLEAGIAAQVGYQWFPVDGSGFYVRPWVLAVVPLWFSEERELAGESFEEPLPVRFVPSVYAGWEL